MRIFHCDHCHNPIYFENVQCLRCGHTLAYAPDLSDMVALEETSAGNWRALPPEAEGRQYRLCQNWTTENVCNWTVPIEDESPLCRSCRLTRVIPDLDRPRHRERWFALEVAKRRLLYSLLELGLPVVEKSEEHPDGLVFEFLADQEPPVEGAPPVLTGHAEGVITINVIEADDAERERRRLALHEPYRTLLGHVRHEVGHYYWDRLIRDSVHLDRFRELFGDERDDYQQALQRHYDNGPDPNWPSRCVTAYASVHPWEDWAETWAHYLHMTDTLETASDCGLVLRPRRSTQPAGRPRFSMAQAGRVPFEQIIADWLAVSHVLNNLGRALGQGDAYPFVISEPVVEKLRFVHRVCAQRLK